MRQKIASSVVSSITVLVMLAVTWGLPLGRVQALQSKAYLFNAETAGEYDTTGSLSFAEDNTTATWFDSAWAYRQKVTIHKEWIGEDLADFPVLIRLNEKLIDGLRDDLHDLVIAADDGTTKLAHEIEGKAAIWVKVPKLTPTKDVNLYLYYGNPNATETNEQASEVWTNGYVGVWHFTQDPSGTTRDATSSNADGSPLGDNPDDRHLRSGKIDQAVYFHNRHAKKKPDSIEPGTAGVLDITGNITISAWAKPGSVSSKRVVLARYDGASSADDSYFLDFSGDAGRLGLRSSDGGSWAIASASNPVANQWNYLAGTFDGTQVTALINAAAGTPVSKTDSIRSNPEVPVTIGDVTHDETYGSDSHTDVVGMDGEVDELRISNTSRSTAWIRAEYTNQCDCEDFLTINDEIESQSGDTTVTLKPADALPFTRLATFTANTGGVVEFQLSNDAGKTWYFYTQNGWKKANPANPTHRSSGRDINGHLATFPKGDGKLAWKAYLHDGASLDAITIDFEPGVAKTVSVTPAGAPTSLSDPRIVAINSLFRQAFGRNPTVDEWLHWATRMLNGEKTTAEEVLGAMEWASLRSQ